MSPAKKRKPARRAASRAAPTRGRAAPARKGAPAHKAAPAASRRTARPAPPEPCTLPVRRLAALLDGGERAELLAHVPACGACSTTLTVLAAEAQGLQRLTLASGGGTAVERILARGVRQGDRRLADLVYEMTKACLVVVQDIDRRLHLATRPRDAAVIERDVRGVASRLPARLREAASAVPHGKPDEGQALAAAESCVRILERVEGASERQRLAKSVWLICAGRAGEAEELLSPGLDATQGGCHRRQAYWNLLWSLVRQEKYESVLRRGEQALSEFPGDWVISYNLVAASARCGRRLEFKTFASRLKRLGEAGKPEWFESRLLAFEVTRMADDLGLSGREVRKRLGLRSADHAGVLNHG